MTGLTGTGRRRAPEQPSLIPEAGHEAHTDLVNRCLIRLSEMGVLAWRNPTGRAVAPSGAVFGFGLKGSSDILGVIPPNGRALAVECKTGTGRLSRQQEKFAAAFAKRGGIFVLARSPEDAALAVQHAMGSAAQVGWRA